ncbi:MAG: TonB-dependent receptor plug domain-containing protein [Lutibacter sp.]
MKKLTFKIMLVVMLLFVHNVKAQQKKDSVEHLKEVVISATKFAIKKEKVGKIILKISPSEIENAKGKTVTEFLNEYAGIEINGANSADSKNKSVFIRGGRNRQVLVLIDGVPVSDPSGINNIYDLRLLSLEEIESIEIMNGAASTLYGSGASTGIINITLKKANFKPISLHYQTVVGTNKSSENKNLNINEFQHHLSVMGSEKNFNYLTSLSTLKTDGISEASDKNVNYPFEKDAFLSTNALIKLGYQFSKKLTTTFITNYDHNNYDFDAGAFSDSDINHGKNKQLRLSLKTDINYANGSLKTIVSYQKNNRWFNSFNSWSNQTDYFEYNGKSIFADVVNKLKLIKNVQLISGITYQEFKNDTKTPYGDIDESLAHYTNVDGYLNLIYNGSNGVNLSVGTRLNNHSEYGNHWVYNINPSYNITKQIKLFASYSTAFIAPSTYQLFSQYGNTNLKPETNESIETGFSFNKPKLGDLDVLFFYRNEENAIILPDFVTYSNATDQIKAKGIESRLAINLISNFQLKLGYAYTYKSADLDYIPKNKLTAGIETNAIKNTFFSLNLTNISKRTYFDQWGSGSNIIIDGYTLINFYGKYDLIKNKVSVFGSVFNLLNKDYTEIIGYTTKGSNFRIGLNFKF